MRQRYVFFRKRRRRNSTKLTLRRPPSAPRRCTRARGRRRPRRECGRSSSSPSREEVVAVLRRRERKKKKKRQQQRSRSSSRSLAAVDVAANATAAAAESAGSGSPATAHVREERRRGSSESAARRRRGQGRRSSSNFVEEARERVGFAFFFLSLLQGRASHFSFPSTQLLRTSPSPPSLSQTEARHVVLQSSVRRRPRGGLLPGTSGGKCAALVAPARGRGAQTQMRFSSSSTVGRKKLLDALAPLLLSSLFSSTSEASKASLSTSAPRARQFPATEMENG